MEGLLRDGALRASTVIWALDRSVLVSSLPRSSPSLALFREGASPLGKDCPLSLGKLGEVGRFCGLSESFSINVHRSATRL